MLPLIRLLSPRRWTDETYETAGFPLSGVSLSPHLGLMAVLLLIELPLLYLVLIGPVFFNAEGWHVALLIPARLIGFYGLVLAQRQRLLFAHTWMHTPFAHMVDLYWAWVLPLIMPVISALFFLIVPWLEGSIAVTTAFYIVTVLAWLTLLSMVPTWLWCFIQSIRLALKIQHTPTDRYRHGQ